MGAVVMNGPVSGTTKRQRLAESLRGLVQEGIRIKTQKVWSAGILQDARQLKLDWSKRVTDLLDPVGEDWAAPFNSWRGQLLPERSELRLFVEQFLSEMDHRVKELEGTIERLMSLEPLEAIPVQPVAWKGVEECVGETCVEASQMAAVTESGNETLAEMEDLMEDRPLAGAGAARAPAPVPASAAGGGLLIVHHSDAATQERLAEYMRRLGFELTVVRRPVSEAGPGEKLPHTESFAFALVLSGPGGDEPQHPRTVFELGYCAGRFGPERVCVVHPQGAGEAFRDECDLPHVPLDRADGWQLQIARQLKRSGIDLDLNKLY